MKATSFYNGVSGVKAFSDGLNVVSDNVANSSTHGFKAARTEFADVLYTQLYSSSADLTTMIDQVGQGAQTWVQNMMTQGAIEETGRTLDMAIDGGGFFTVKQPDEDRLYYTRAGQFSLDGRADTEGFIVNDEGYRLQGFALDANGDPILGALVDLQVPLEDLAGQATDLVNVGVNLDPSDTQQSTQATDIDPEDSSTYNYSNSITVYDANGEQHNLTVFYQRVSDYSGALPDEGQTVWKAAVFEEQDGELVANPAAPDNSFYLSFTDTGALAGTISNAGVVDAGGLAGLTMDFDAGQQAITFDFAPDDGQASTQVAQGYANMTLTQNGFAEGGLEGISVAEDGMLTAVYSNGELVDFGVVALTQFASPGNLQREGDNLWSATEAAGEPQTGQPTDEELAMGSIEDEALEVSNVDIASEMVNMIIYQRAFQASSKSISTSDEMIKTAISMKT